jgi:hypothetical protein
MDHHLHSDTERKLRQLADQPDLDVHLRIQEHRIEGYAWCNGKRYRLLGVRDEERDEIWPDGDADVPGREPPGVAGTIRS